MANMTGGCLCGAVKFNAGSVDKGFQACHCGMCRRWTGGPLLATEAKGVTFEGEDNVTVFSSSDWGERGFCGVCGTNLFFRMKGSDVYYLCIGAFDEASEFRLTREIFIDNKPQGYDFAGDRLKLTEAQVVSGS